MTTVIVEPTAVTVTVTSSTTPAPPATTTTVGTVQLAGDLAGTATAPTVAKIQGTTIQTPPGGTSLFLAGNGTWQSASAASGVQIGGDIGGTNLNPQIISTHLSAALPIAQGGTAATTQQAAINSLTGTQSAGKYLRSDGTNAALATIQAGDVPTLNQNTSGTAAGLSATLAIGSGGTGQTTAAGAVAALGAVASTECDMLGVGALTASVFGSGFTVLQTAGNMVCCLVTPPKTVQVTKLAIWVTTAAATANGVNGLALYSEAGSLIDQTGDLSTTFTNAAPQWAEGSLGATQTLTVGNNYYFCVLTHYSGTEPRFAATGTASSGNIPVTNGHYPAVFKTAQASFPASFVPSSFTLNSGVYLMYAR